MLNHASYMLKNFLHHVNSLTWCKHCVK